MPILQDVEREGREMSLLRKQDLIRGAHWCHFFPPSLKHEKITMKNL